MLISNTIEKYTSVPEGYSWGAHISGEAYPARYLVRDEDGAWIKIYDGGAYALPLSRAAVELGFRERDANEEYDRNPASR